MLFFGVPANVANGTNRVGILLQGGVNFYTFHKNKKIPYKRFFLYFFSCLTGALLGAYQASIVPSHILEIVISVVMILVVFLTLGKKMLLSFHLQKKTGKKNTILKFLLFLFLGFYGGFIQIGFGLIMLAVLTFVDDFDVVEANGIKNFVTFLYTIPVFFIFLFQGLIFWKIAIFLALGQTIGAYFSGMFLIKSKNSEKVVAFLLLVMVIATLLRSLL